MSRHDIRWIQRFDNFKRAFARLSEASMLAEQRGLTDLERQGLIQSFEFTHELAWNTLKDFLAARGVSGKLYGSRDVREAGTLARLVRSSEHARLAIHSHFIGKKVVSRVSMVSIIRFNPMIFKWLRRLGSNQGPSD